MAATTNVGDIKKVQVEIRDEAGTLADPPTVKLFVRKLRTDEFEEYTYLSEPDITKVSTGVYKAYLTLDVPETWLVAWKGIGGPDTYEEAEFYVSPQRAVEIVP